MGVSFNDFKKKHALEISKDAPQAIVTLPSDGTKVTLRPMKVREQKEFLKAMEKKDEFLLNEAFDNILNTCVISINDGGFDNDKICVQDRMFLLIKIRQLSSGDKIKIAHYIEKTEKVEQIEVDMTKFQIETATEPLIKEIQLTPNTKVVLGPVTRKNEKDMEKWLKSKNVNKESLIERRYCAYAAFIKEIHFIPDGETEYKKVEVNFDQLVEFIIDSCSEQQLKQFDEFAKTLNFGIKLIYPVKVDGYENEKEEVSLISFFIV